MSPAERKVIVTALAAHAAGRKMVRAHEVWKRQGGNDSGPAYEFWKRHFNEHADLKAVAARAVEELAGDDIGRAQTMELHRVSQPVQKAWEKVGT